MKLIALLFLTSLLSACKQEQPPIPPGFILNEPRTATSSPQNGRYVIVFSPLVPQDKFLLDTQKGKVWQLTKYPDLVGEPTVWEDMGITDNSADASERIPGSLTTLELLKRYPKKGENKEK